MNWTAKTRLSNAVTATPSKPGVASSASATAASANFRISNGLKEFLSHLEDEKNPRILDLGQVSQATLTFFIEKGFKITTEDSLRSWKEFLTAEEEGLRLAPVGNGGQKISQAYLAEKFLETGLRYADESFHGVLAWDLLDYFDAELLPRVMERLYSLLHPSGVVLAMFHSRAAERFHRYRIVDTQTIEVLSAPTLAVHAHVFQNREILDLFGKFRSSKTFVGRDQLREALFLK
ncbi:MAG: class I SAM-dependent methyltransferase [Candidatus Acidiferrales bacterium]